MRSYDASSLAQLLPYPQREANKYTRGKLTLLVGSRTYPGAAGLAALASQRAGAGYSEVYVEDSVVSQLQIYHPSLVVKEWSAWDMTDEVASTAKRPHAYVVGSGFDSQDPFIAGITHRLLKRAQAPVLVDGGALKLMPARKIRDLCKRRYEKGFATVITPHGGEAKVMASVFALPTDDPEELSLTLSQAYGAITVLKGPDTYISDGDSTYRMEEGTAALSKAGTGDVLAGIIGAFMAQAMDPVDACVLGTTLHARSGVLAARDLGPISVCAEDVIQYLPQAIRALEDERTVS
ncbi:NAD(P)H-hydrate dehydratase [Cryptobacterium curtum]|uniref:NAD(P)H-hydrate dehydratase n=1 Tax=Cryptobacterium curtum TaxID=84163 RepID=UPI00248EC0C6|nr:NAD(P)H-hydrate dehydratase [Cryptobacterium curtum]